MPKTHGSLQLYGDVLGVNMNGPARCVDWQA